MGGKRPGSRNSRQDASALKQRPPDTPGGDDYSDDDYDNGSIENSGDISEMERIR